MKLFDLKQPQDFEDVLSRLYDCVAELRERSAALKEVRNQRSLNPSSKQVAPPAKKPSTLSLLQQFRPSCLLLLTALRRFYNINSRPDGQASFAEFSPELCDQQYPALTDSMGMQYYPDATPMEEWAWMQQFRYGIRDELYSTFEDLGYTHYSLWAPSDIILIACTIEEYCNCFPFLSHHTWTPQTMTTQAAHESYHEILYQYQKIVSRLMIWLMHAITWYNRRTMYKSYSLIPPHVLQEQLPQVLHTNTIVTSDSKLSLLEASGQYSSQNITMPTLEKAIAAAIDATAMSPMLLPTNTTTPHSQSTAATVSSALSTLSPLSNLATVEIPKSHITDKQARVLIRDDGYVALSPSLLESHSPNDHDLYPMSDDFTFAHKDTLLHFTESKLEANLYSLKRQQLYMLLATRMRGRSRGYIRRLVMEYASLLRTGSLSRPKEHRSSASASKNKIKSRDSNNTQSQTSKLSPNNTQLSPRRNPAATTGGKKSRVAGSTNDTSRFQIPAAALDMHSILQHSTLTSGIQLEPLPTQISDAEQEILYNHLFFKTANPTTVSLVPIDISNADEVLDVHIRRYLYKAILAVMNECSPPPDFSPPPPALITDNNNNNHTTSPIQIATSARQTNRRLHSPRRSGATLNGGPHPQITTDDSQLWASRHFDGEASMMSLDIATSIDSGFSFANTTLHSSDQFKVMFQQIFSTRLKQEILSFNTTKLFQNHTMRWFDALFETIFHDLSYSNYQFQRLVRFARQIVTLQQKHTRILTSIQNKQQQNMKNMMAVMRKQQNVAWERAQARNAPLIGFDIPLNHFYNKKQQELIAQQQKTLGDVISRHDFELRERVQQLTVLEHHVIHTCTSHLAFLVMLLLNWVPMHSHHQYTVNEVDSHDNNVLNEKPSISPPIATSTTNNQPSKNKSPFIPSRSSRQYKLFTALHYLLLLHTSFYNYLRYFSSNPFHFGDLYTVQPPPSLTQRNNPVPSKNVLTKTTSLRIVTGNSSYAASYSLLRDCTRYKSALNGNNNTVKFFRQPLTKQDTDQIALQMYAYDPLHEPLYTSSDDLFDFLDDDHSGAEETAATTVSPAKSLSQQTSTQGEKPMKYHAIGNKQLRLTPRAYFPEEQQTNDDDESIAWYASLDHHILEPRSQRTILTQQDAIDAVQQSLAKANIKYITETDVPITVTLQRTAIESSANHKLSKPHHQHHQRHPHQVHSGAVSMMPLETTCELQNLYLGLFAQSQSTNLASDSSTVAAFAVAAAVGETPIPGAAAPYSDLNNEASYLMNLNDPRSPFSPSAMLARRKHGVEFLRQHFTAAFRSVYSIIGLYTCSCTSDTALGKFASGFQSRCSCELIDHVLIPSLANWKKNSDQVTRFQTQSFGRSLCRPGDLYTVWRYLQKVNEARAPPAISRATAGPASRVVNSRRDSEANTATGTSVAPQPDISSLRKPGAGGGVAPPSSIIRSSTTDHSHTSSHHHHHHQHHHRQHTNSKQKNSRHHWSQSETEEESTESSRSTSPSPEKSSRHSRNQPRNGGTKSRTKNATRKKSRHESSRSSFSSSSDSSEEYSRSSSRHHRSNHHSSNSRHGRHHRSDRNEKKTEHGLGGFFSSLFHKKK